MVQLVETPDGRLAGRVESVTINAAGDIQDNAVSVEGAADGRQITLSVKVPILGGFAPSMTAFLDGNLLDLTWQSGHDVLRRGDAYQFEAAVNALRARSAAIKSEQSTAAAARAHEAAVAALLQDAQVASDRVADLSNSAPQITAKLGVADDRYRELGQQIGRRRRQARLLALTPGAGLEAMNRGVKGQGLSLDLQSVHGDVTALGGTARAQLSDTRNAISRLELDCRGVGEDSRAVRSCADLTNERQALNSAAAQLQAAFDQAEHAYQLAIAEADDQRPLLQRLRNPIGSDPQ